MVSMYTRTIPSKPKTSPAPLSLSQQRLWFIYQLNPQIPAYNISRSWRLKGALDPSALETSLNLILARHESLRTIFQEVNGEPVQIIQPASFVTLRKQDLSALSSPDLEIEIARIQVNEPLQPFHMTTGPLIRFMLLQCGPNDHVFIFCVHHIIFDGTSLKNFCQELSLCYQRALTDHPIPLASLPIQYQDYSCWQKEHYSNEKLASQMIFWKEQLLGAPLVLEIPLERPQSKDLSTEGNVQTFTIAPRMISQLQALIQPQGITMFMALLTVFQILLMRYTGQQDILVGVPTAGRNNIDLDKLLGFFVNTLVLRMECKRQSTFQDILQQNRTTCFKSYRQSDFPFEKIVELLRPPRDSDKHPVVQTIFQLRQASDIKLFFPEVEALPYPVKKRTGNFDLHMVCEETDSGLQGTLYYPQTLYSDAAMARFAKHYQILLETFLTNPEQPVMRAPFLTQVEYKQLLVDWNQTTKALPSPQGVHQLFEEQVERAPDAIAVVFGDQQLTYGQLDRRANQLAHFLRTHGVESDMPVGLCMERGLELITSLLGIWKAGGAYVPLDPSYPKERLRYIVAHSKPPCILTQPELCPWLTDTTAIRIDLDSDYSCCSHYPSHTPNFMTTKFNLAYIIYTSGSTGAPKGVMVTHHSTLNLLLSLQAHVEIDETSAVLAVTSLSFDISVLEFFGPLIGRGRLVLADREVAKDGTALRAVLQSRAITLMQATPSTWDLLFQANPSPLPKTLNILCGGEALTPTLAQKMESSGGSIWNVYGPTETTIWSTIWKLPHQHGNISIGRPLANTTVFVVDQNEEIATIGVPGELLIGGDGMARGYQRHPVLTAEKFIPHPFSSEPGARLYRSGDRARYRAEGMIEYLGRFDQQIKLRGFRIEPGEIETLLQQQTDVKDAVVLLREDSPDNHQLIAYVVLTSDAALDPSTLRVTLKTYLPDYMIPAAFVTLETLPLTPNGKIDRKALPEPNSSFQAAAHSYLPPQGPVEEQVAEIWKELLRVGAIGRHDNFFERGGHSLLAMQVIARTRVRVQINVSVRALFDNPTLSQFAQAVQRALASGTTISSQEIRRRTTEATTPLSFAQQRLWFFKQWAPESPTYHIPSAWHLRGLVDYKALAASFTMLIARHDSLRTTFSQIDNQPVQVIHAPSPVAVPVVDLTSLTDVVQDAELARLIEKETHRQFDLTAGPLFRAQLFLLGRDHAVLLVTLHHIITDGWSMGIFWDELSALYTSQRTGHTATLARLPIQYADFAVWQREWLQGDTLRQQVHYWTTQLANAPSALELPLDFPRPVLQSLRGAMETFTLSRALTQDLKTLSQRESVTLFMTLIAVFQLLLARYTGQQDILVGTPIAGRTHDKLEGLIGLFVNTLVIRTPLQGAPTGRTLLQSIREVCLDAFANQDFPFEKLVEELHPIRDPSRHPVFQVMFHLIPPQEQGLSLPGVNVTPYPRPHTTAKFDLTCTLREHDGMLHGTLEYCTDLFETASITRMAQHFQILLEGIVKNPDHPVFHLPLLTDTDQQRQLIEWNGTMATSSQESTIAELFEAQVAKTPEAVAVVFDDEQLVYESLNTKANQLAHYLKKLGVGPEVRVGVCLERSVDLVISLLGILKAGGAYVPLDPDYPTNRLAYMVNDAQPLVLLTRRSLVATLPSHQGKLVCLETEWPRIAHEPTSSIRRAGTLDNLAYVTYTSGSTGRPKGVGVVQRGVVRLVQTPNYVEFTEDEVILQFAPFTFDASTFEIWGALLNGGRLVLCAERRPSLDELSQLIQRTGITTLWLTASLFHQMTVHAADAFYQVRQLLTGGDVVSVEHANQFCVQHPSVRLINGYGPTENTTFSCCYEINSTDSDLRTLPIGRPISQTQVYVLNPHLELNPVRVDGELYLGGMGLARGYWNQPELTATRFLPDPFATQEGARLFRTGDWGRYRANGLLEFVGRRDTQIKLRGFRIELGEIETRLEQQAEVKNAVVLLREDSPPNQQIVAYIVPAPGKSFEPSTLRVALKMHLPDYMLPTSFMMLETWPLTPNGKIDRQALPAPDMTHRSVANVYEPPQTQVEEMLAEVWQDLLQLEHAGRHDHFFKLGGHSLLATQLMARLREQLVIDLPLRLLFEHPTLMNQAQAIEERLLLEYENVPEPE